MPKIVILLLLTLPLTSVMVGQTASMRTTGLRDNLYVIDNVGPPLEGLRSFGGDVTVYVTNDGVLLVDCKFDKNHDDVMAMVKAVTNKPVKYLVLTHNHGDHAEGAEKMEASGATVIISAEDRENMSRQRNQKWLPKLTYTHFAQIFLGEREIQLRELRGHTRGDTIVYFPAEHIVSLGDLITSLPEIPWMVNYGDGGSWIDWEKAMNEVLALDFEYAIPGHGPYISKQGLVDLKDKYVRLRERVRELVREGKSETEIKDLLRTEFQWGLPASNTLPGMIQEMR